MPEPNLLLLLYVRRFNELALRYMITGGAAAIVYGEPRLTNGVDLVVVLDRERIARLPGVFPPSDFYCPPQEAILAEAARERKGHFNIIHLETGFKADIYPSGRDPLNLWGLVRARRFEIEGEILMVAPPEYVILRKLEYFREGGSEKHIRDIRAMLLTSLNEIPLLDLEERIAELGLEKEWGVVRKDSLIH